MVNIPLPGLPDINVNLPDVNLPNIPGIGLWPGIRDIDVEKEFWAIIDKADQLIIKERLPLPTLGPILRQFSFIDSEKFYAAAQVWGRNADEPGIPTAIAKGVEDRVEDACKAVNDRWEGNAATQFNGWMEGLVELVEEYGAPAHQVGNALHDLAEEFKLNWLEIIGFVVGIAGLIDGLLPRINAAKAAMEVLKEQVNKKIPQAPDARVPLPNRYEWDSRSPDDLYN